MLINVPMPVLGLPDVEAHQIPVLLMHSVEPAFEVYPAIGVAPIVAGLGGFLLKLGISGGVLVGGGFLLKEFFGISSEDIVPSLLLGGAGATLFFARDFFKEDSVAQPILAIGGIGVGIASLIVLFSGTAEAAVPEKPPVEIAPSVVPPEEQVPDLPPGQLSLFINAALDPAQPRTGGNTRSLFTDQEFEFSLRNDSNAKLSFFVGLTMVAQGQEVVFETQRLQRKLITLGPNDSMVERLTAPSATSFILVPQTLAVEVNLYRNRDDVVAFRRSDAIPIKFSFIG